MSIWRLQHRDDILPLVHIIYLNGSPLSCMQKSCIWVNPFHAYRNHAFGSTPSCIQAEWVDPKQCVFPTYSISNTSVDALKWHTSRTCRNHLLTASQLLISAVT